MDKDKLVLNVIKYCAERGEPPTKVCDAAGVGKNFLGHLQRGSIPSVEKVMDLAAYLGVTTSDLVGDTKKEPADKNVDELERSFEFLIKSLGPEERKKLAQAMIDKLNQ